MKFYYIHSIICNVQKKMANTKITKRKRTNDERMQNNVNEGPDDIVEGPSTSKQAKSNQVGLVDYETRKKLVTKLQKELKMQDEINLLQSHVTDMESNLFYPVPMKRDGNTLYRSISYLLFEHQNYHMRIRDVTFKAMLRFKDILDKDCFSTTQTYSDVTSYINETHSNEYDRTSNGFLEMKALALYFGVPIYLFTYPVSSPPNVFEPRTNKNARGFVLFKDGGYIRPVTKFDGVNFKHKCILNENNTTVHSEDGFSFTCTIDELDTFSAELCREVVTQEHFQCKLDENSFNKLSMFVTEKAYDLEICDIDVYLFNFACKYNAYWLTEMMISKVKECKDCDILLKFLEELSEDTARFRNELFRHFINVCHMQPDQKLLNLKSYDIKLGEIIENVIESKTKYVLVTEDLTVKLKGESEQEDRFAFKDIFPLSVISFCKKSKSFKYFTGPKPDKSRWIPLELNNRLKDELSCAEQMLFVGKTIFFYSGLRDGNHQIAYLMNVFDYTQFIHYKALSKPSKSLKKPTIVLDQKQHCYLVDVDTSQVYSVRENRWLKVQSMVTTLRTTSLEHVAISLQTENGDEKIFVVLSHNNTPQASHLYQTTANGRLKFQYDINRTVRDFKVTKRLAENQLYFDATNQWRESQIIQYAEDLEAHYIVPSAGQLCLYALTQTSTLNKNLQAIQITDIDNKA